jgi:hypothetical protein
VGKLESLSRPQAPQTVCAVGVPEAQPLPLPGLVSTSHCGVAERGSRMYPLSPHVSPQELRTRK